MRSNVRAASMRTPALCRPSIPCFPVAGFLAVQLCCAMVMDARFAVRGPSRGDSWYCLSSIAILGQSLWPTHLLNVARSVPVAAHICQYIRGTGVWQHQLSGHGIPMPGQILTEQRRDDNACLLGQGAPLCLVRQGLGCVLRSAQCIVQNIPSSSIALRVT